MPEQTLKSSALTARIDSMGAELNSLKTHNERELIWQADPKVWPRHAPLLFPIVGRLKNDTLTYQGDNYPISQHGFARDLEFQLTEQSDSSCTFLLASDTETKKHYPFSFELKVRYRLKLNCLEVCYSLINPDKAPLYASIGGHPAFVWPLDPATAKENHLIEFQWEETAPIRRLNNGLIEATPYSSVVSNRKLHLSDSLFREDAIIFDRLRSRRVSYSGGAMRITVDFEDFPHLGIWSKPGADFICIEPWQGYASSETFEGEFSNKPGIIEIGAHQQRQWCYTISVTGY